ncbi:MAG: primosomal protein N', partial [Elusimicrobiota bacterium]
YIGAVAGFLSSQYIATWAQSVQTALPVRLFLGNRRPGFPGRANPWIHTAQGRNKIDLSIAQQGAWQSIRDSYGTTKKPVYLWGPTGSGKSFVLLKFMSELIAQGKGSIYLVPEIALTPQFARMFAEQLPDGARIAIWSSKTPEAAKRGIYEALLAGTIDAVLGTRSAIFLPMKDLGAIIIDEEQDSSFKQETPSPAYHARDVALWRVGHQSAIAIFASATPSLECYSMMQENIMLKAKIAGRYGNAGMPTIRVTKLYRPQHPVNRDVIDAIKETVEAGGQALVFHNRRGFVRTLCCQACGKYVDCTRCDLPLTLHNTDDGSKRLKCHHCGLRKNVPTACPDCGSAKSPLAERGMGTQKIAREIEAFLNIKTLRLDKDTTGDAQAIYRDFESGAYKVLIGTKIITKGWHFPAVTLVVVLDADTEMMLPDFRACERAFQTLVQVAGRAGRGAHPGTVIVQTRQPQHPIFASLAANDWEAFYAQEAALRKQVRLPPFARIVSIELTGKDEQGLQEAADTCAAHINAGNIFTQDLEVMGASAGFYHRIQGRFRQQIILRWTQAALPFPKTLIWEAIGKVKNSRIRIKLHPDPYDLF